LAEVKDQASAPAGTSNLEIKNIRGCVSRTYGGNAKPLPTSGSIRQTTSLLPVAAALHINLSELLRRLRIPVDVSSQSGNVDTQSSVHEHQPDPQAQIWRSHHNLTRRHSALI
jgi:hypothetical protein